MIANHGYLDGSGEFFIRIDTDKCDGCGDCVTACPAGVLQLGEDGGDPFRETPVAGVIEGHRRKIKYSCGPCKPVADRPPLRCVSACKPGALEHSW